MKGASTPQFWGFSVDHAVKLTGASKRQLTYWHRTGLFRPELLNEELGRDGRVYSFRDVVGLRTLAILRNRHFVPLQELRRVDDWLRRHHETPWASLTFYVAGRHVVFPYNEGGELVTSRPFGQKPMKFAMAKVARDVEKRVARLSERRQRDVGRVTQKRRIAHNEHVLAGTRIPVRVIREFNEVGYSKADILREFPTLNEGDVEAAIAFRPRRRRRAA